MSEFLTWLAALVAGYFAYAIFWGATTARGVRSTSDLLAAGHQVPAWLFVLVATGACLSAWNLAGLPALMACDGLPAGTLALGAVAVALTGVLFLKRQWLLARRNGDLTQGQVFARYYQGDALRVLTVVVALLFAIPFAAQQLAWGGRMLAHVSAGRLEAHGSAWVLGIVLCLYLCFGGLRALVAVGGLQGILTVAGVVALGFVAYWETGGFAGLQSTLARIAASGLGAADTVGTGQHPWFSIPGVLQFTAGIGAQAPAGGHWTALMILSTVLALMGLQASPGFAQLAFGCCDTRGFAAQQVWAGAGISGLALLAFVVPQGMGARVAGADALFTQAGLARSAVLQTGLEDVVSSWLHSLAASAPWWSALLAVCALAAVHVAAAVWVLGGAASVAADVFHRFMVPAASDRDRRLAARLCIVLILLLGLMLETFAPRVLAMTGAVALGAAAQLLPVLAGLCWWRWITRQGATLGVCAGLIAVVLTEGLGGAISSSLGLDLPWGRWPWTIHSAGWGLAVNVLVCTLVSLATRGGEAADHRAEHHRLLNEQAGPSAPRRLQRPAVWAFALIWFFFGIGPGAVLGNDVFGDPGAGLTAWTLGVPSLWAWQVLWWAIGVLVVWWLAYPMEMATPLRAPVDRAEPNAVAPVHAAPAWIRNLLQRVT